jgi:hypothetical protein
MKSNSVGMLLDPRGATVTAAVPAARLAGDVVHGRLVDDVARDVAAAWGAAHAR